MKSITVTGKMVNLSELYPPERPSDTSKAGGRGQQKGGFNQILIAT